MAIDKAVVGEQGTATMNTNTPGLTLDWTVETLRLEVDGLKQRMVSLADANKEMAAVIDTKRKRVRDYWPAAFGLLTFSIVATLGYQVWKAAEITQMLTEARSDRVKQSQLAGDLTQSIVLLSLGYRDDARGRQGSAFRRAEKAVERLSRWEPYVNARLRPALASQLSSEQKEEFAAVSNLLPAVEEALVASYELQGRSGFFLMDSPDPQVAKKFLGDTERVGRMIISLNPTRWTGPHFLALALDKASKAELRGSAKRNALQEEVEGLYEKSVELDPAEGALDLLNYAEAQLMAGNFAKAISYSDRYKALDRWAPPEHVVACNFILGVARYAQSKLPADLLAVQQAARKVARTRFQNYSWSDYKDLLESKDSPIKQLKNPVVAANLMQVIGAAYHSTGRDAWSAEAIKQSYPFMALKD
jgi:hypothetical protein